MKKLLLFLIIALFALPSKVLALDEIKGYDVQMFVDVRNRVDVYENINAIYYTPSNFFYLIKNNELIINRTDGSRVYATAKTYNIEATKPYRTYTSDEQYGEAGYSYIKIGDEYTKFYGEQLFDISYTYDMGREYNPDYDEFYFNIVMYSGNFIDISDIAFMIKMPKPFDASKIKFETDDTPHPMPIEVNYRVDGNIITGYYPDTLNSGLSIRIVLPEGYFINPYKNLSFLDPLSFILPFLFLIFAYYLWIKNGNDKNVINSVCFYPPEEYNSAEIGFLRENKIKNKDISTLLIYLANKGYIKITEGPEKSYLFGKEKTYIYEKLKEYDGTNEIEKIFMNGFFRGGNKITKNSPMPDFEITIQAIKNKFDNNGEKYEVFDNVSVRNQYLVIIMIIIILIVVSFKPLVEYENSYLKATSLLVFISSLLGGMCAFLNMDTIKNSIYIKPTQYTVRVGIAYLICMLIPAVLTTSYYTLAFVIGIVCIVVMLIFIQINKRRTDNNIKILGELNGLKKFIKKGKKSKLDKLVLQDPNYFCKILPYAYTLGSSEKWFKKLELIGINPPKWYESKGEFDINNFYKFCNSSTMYIDYYFMELRRKQKSLLDILFEKK